MIVESKHPVAPCCEKRIPTRILFEVLRREMLSAIDLDHQIRRVTYEIDSVGADGDLAAEACTVHSMGS